MFSTCARCSRRSRIAAASPSPPHVKTVRSEDLNRRRQLVNLAVALLAMCPVALHEQAESSTFAALAHRYLQEHSRRFKRSTAADERNLRLHVLPSWGKRRYDEIQRRDVIALCEGMIAAGTATNANRVQALISSIFSFAVDADLIGTNPCLRLRKRGVEKAATRVLNDGEIRLFWHGIVKRPVTRSVGLALRIVLLTGARVSEISEAELDEFDRLDEPERAVWVIPAARSKNGRAHPLPLPSLAI